MSAPAQVSFTDQTQAAGVSMQHSISTGSGNNIMIAGGAVADFNQDGWPDLFAIGGGGTADHLFINNGDGTFTNQAAAWGVEVFHHGIGASAADFNNDGWPDIYVTSFGVAGSPTEPGKHRLYQNTGNNGFVEVAAAAGVNQTSASVADGFGSAFGDYDRDGYLDLFVCGWELLSGGNRLFRNNGDGTFSDTTVAAGVSDNAVRGFAPTFADMDGDGYPELLHISDAGTSRYYINNGDGTFTKMNPRPPRINTLNGMGVAVGDVNGDDLLDFYGTSIYWDSASGNMLWLNQGNHEYLEVGQSADVNNGGWGWGTLMMDCDHDGWLDIVETNGWSSPQFDNFPSRLFVNNGDETFTESAVAAGITHDLQGRGVVNFDYDLDGDQDLVFFSNKDELQLYRNETGSTDGAWLRLELETDNHPYLAPNGFGATVEVTTNTGKRVRQYLDSRTSYLSQSEWALHFGLDDATSIDQVTVRWADHTYTFLGGMSVNQNLKVASGMSMEAPFMMAPGDPGEMIVEGATPGAFVLFLYSPNGMGPGICKNQLGGLCIDLLEPVITLGGATADADGKAVLPAQMGPLVKLEVLFVQAVMPAGLNGADSKKSNAAKILIRP